jgi:hypothetical protein
MAPKKDKATTALMVKGQDVPSVLQVLEEKNFFFETHHRYCL